MTARYELRDADIKAMLQARASRSTLSGLLDRVMHEVHAGAPRRPASGLPWSSGLLGLGAVAAGVLLAVVAFSGLVRPLGPGTPTPSPTAPPSPTSTVQPMVPVGLDGPAMAAGTYETVFFEPGLEFTVPGARWVAGQDFVRQWFLRYDGPDQSAQGVDALTIVNVTNVYVEPCLRGAGGGTVPWTGDAAAFFQWLDANLPIGIGTPTPTTIFGRPALQVQLVMSSPPACSGFVPFTDVGRAFGATLPGQTTRYTAVDIDGQTLLVATWATDPARWGAVRRAADEVLGTITFGN